MPRSLSLFALTLALSGCAAADVEYTPTQDTSDADRDDVDSPIVLGDVQLEDTIEDTAPDTSAPDTDPTDTGEADTSVDTGPATDTGTVDTTIAGCARGLTECDGECVDLRTDRDHCRACGEACPASAECVSGTCICAGGEAACGGACVDTQSDPANCGICGWACVPGAECRGGVCGCPGAGEEMCDGGCVDLQRDDDHCGGCGNTCDGELSCVGGACACTGGLHACGGACVDLNSDQNHCGICGNRCNALQSCRSGTCDPPFDPVRWDFNRNGDTEGWTTHNVNDVNGGPVDGQWIVGVPGSDPMFISPPVSIPAGAYGRVRVHMANDHNPSGTSTMQVFWTAPGGSFTEGQSATVRVSNGGGWADYTLDVGSHAGWSGTIGYLRVDPITAGDGHAIGIDYVVVE